MYFNLPSTFRLNQSDKQINSFFITKNLFFYKNTKLENTQNLIICYEHAEVVKRRRTIILDTAKISWIQ